MGPWPGGSGGAPALVHSVAAALTSWLGALLSAILLVRGLLPSVKLRTGHANGRTAEQQRQQLRSADEADQPSPAEQAAPPGYNRGVEQLRRSEFSRLRDRVYADYAGAAPYSERLLAEALAELSSSLHGNPHSEAGWAPDNRSAAADAARLATLRWCNADPEHYCCIFTAGATAGLKLVGESFPWCPASAFVHLRDNHTSVLGIRQLAAQHGAACPAAAVQVAAAPASVGQQEGSSAWRLAACSEAAAASLGAAAAQAGASSSSSSSQSRSSSSAGEPQHLFALPLESNFSGVCYDQRLVPAVQSGGVQWASEDSSGGSSNDNGSNRAGPTPFSSSSSSSSSSGGGGGPCAARPLPAGRWRVLLDAAKGAASCPPDLSRFPADFVALSYYKAFGWPTGLGALLVRRDALPCLRRCYFGGGTVEVALADEPFHRLRPGPAGWEDGTPPFLDLPAVAAGFRFIERLGGFPAVAAHAMAVAFSLASQLAALRHSSGAPVCTLYGAHAALHQQHELKGKPLAQQQGASSCKQQQPAARLPSGVDGQGPVVAFNLRRADGSFVGYREVERLASLCGIMLRTGCCCNPGACAAALDLAAADMRANWEAGHVCWDGRDVIGGRPTGVVRASFGYASSLADAQAIVALVRRYFVEEQPVGAAGQDGAPARGALAAEDRAAAAATVSHAAGMAAPPPAAAGAAAGAAPASAAHAAQQAVGRIGALWVYPIKSCRGFSPTAWPLGPAGLLYDRCWALVDPSGAALRLKQHPALASIAARVDLQRRLLVVTAAGEEQPLEVPLPVGGGAGAPTSSDCGSGGSGNASPCSPCSPGSACGVKTNPEPFSVHVCSRTAWVQRSAAAFGGDVAAAAWFTRVLGTPCRLVQQAAAPDGSGQSAGGAGTAQEAGPAAEAEAGAREEAAAGPAAAEAGSASRSFANEGHLLVVGAASLADLASRAGSSEAPDVFAQRFRPNLAIEGCTAYAEDSWRSISLVPTAGGDSRAASRIAGACAVAGSAPTDCSNGGAVQLCSAGPCARCDMVCIHPLTGRRCGPEPLLSLAGYRRRRGRIHFGQLMNVQRQEPQLRHQEQRQERQQQTAVAVQPAGHICPCQQGGAEAGAAALPAWVAVGDGVMLAASHA